jgi:hypothetical protein
MLTRRQQAELLSKIACALRQRVSHPDRPLTHWRKFSDSQIQRISMDCLEIYQENNINQNISVDELIVVVLGITIFVDIDYASFYELLSQMMQSISNYKSETEEPQPLTELTYTLSTDTISLYSIQFGPDNHQSYLSGYGIMAGIDRFY